MPETEVVDVELQKPAEVTGASPSDATETSTAKETDVKAEPKAAESDPEKDEPKDKDNPLYQRMSKYRTQRNEARETLTKFKDFGIESPDHAEVLQRDANILQVVVEQLENDPEAYRADLKKAFPEALTTIVDNSISEDFSKDPVGFEAKLYKLDPEAHHKMWSNTVSRVLNKAAAIYKQNGDDSAAETLIKVAQEVRNEIPQGKKEEPKRESKSEATNGQWEFFEDQVSSDVTSRLTAKINDEITSRNVQFKDDKQKSKFLESVFGSIDKTLKGDNVFVRERDRVQDPRLGLNKQQRSNAVDLYVKYATLNGRLSRIVAEEVDVRNLPVKVQEKIERKEITGAGIAPSGKLNQDDKDKIWDAGRKKGLSGSDLTAYYFGQVRAMRPGGK